MSDSASKYFDDLEDKAYWAAKELEEQNKSKRGRVLSFIYKLRNLKIKITC